MSPEERDELNRTGSFVQRWYEDEDPCCFEPDEDGDCEECGRFADLAGGLCEDCWAAMIDGGES